MERASIPSSIRFVGDVERRWPRLMPPIIVVSVNRVCTNKREQFNGGDESKVIAVLASGRTTFDGILRTG